MSASLFERLRSYLLGNVLGLERHEYVAVAWSFAYFFCVLSSYYMMRSMREALGVDSGFDSVPWLFSSTFVVMMLASPVFAWVASRYRRRQFLPWVYYFFAANILVFFVVFSYAIAYELNTVWIGRAFFVWVSIFNLFVVSVFWSFMADIYSREQGRRLFGVISAGGSTGALFGPYLTQALVVDIGFQNLLPIAAALLLGGVVCIYRLRAWVDTDREHEHPDSEKRGRPIGGTAFGGIKRIFQSRYLSSICVMSVIASVLGAALYMFMNKFVGDAVAGTDLRTQLFGRIDFWTSLFALIFQLLMVKRAVKNLGVGMTLAFLPLLSAVGFVALALSPVFIFAAVFQGMRRAIGFGFGKPTSDMLYSVVSREEKYKAKNFIDTAVYRSGDLLGTWSVKFMLLPLGIAGVSLVMVPFAIVWTLTALWLGRVYRRRDESGQFHSGTKREHKTLEST